MHPFIDRLKDERYVIASVNAAISEPVQPLRGLGEAEVNRWVAAVTSTMGVADPRHLARALIDTGRQIRAHSAASHRGVSYERARDESDLGGEVTWIMELLRP